MIQSVEQMSLRLGRFYSMRWHSITLFRSWRMQIASCTSQICIWHRTGNLVYGSELWNGFATSLDEELQFHIYGLPCKIDTFKVAPCHWFLAQLHRWTCYLAFMQNLIADRWRPLIFRVVKVRKLKEVL